MSNIELVIKINENTWKRICDSQSVPDMLNIDIVNGLNDIKNGKPLPKGHGRLIDLNDLYDFDRRKVEYATTIIEADKGNEK